jgi:hypothetical protein
MSGKAKVPAYNSDLTVSDCEENITRLFAQYKSIPLENETKREEVMSNIDSWLDTRKMLITLNEKGGVTVGG